MAFTDIQEMVEIVIKKMLEGEDYDSIALLVHTYMDLLKFRFEHDKAIEVWEHDDDIHKEDCFGVDSDTEHKERCVTLDLLREVNKVLLRHGIKEWENGAIKEKIKFPRVLMSTIKVHMENLEK